MMSVLITGASGFLGRQVTAVARSAGAEIVAFGRQVPAGPASDQLRFIAGDLATGAGMEAVPWDRLDAVIHLAAAGVKASRRNWPEAVDVNLVGTARLLTQLSRRALRRPVVFVARTFYEDAMASTPALRENPYIMTKAGSTTLVRLWRDGYGGRVMLGSLFQLYGPGDDPNNVLSYAARSLKASQSCLLGSGRNRRDWLYIDDAASAVWEAVREPERCSAEFDIGAGALWSIAEVVRELARLAGADERLLQFDPGRDRGDQGFELAAARFLPGWQPQVSLAEGLKKLYEAT